MVFRVMQADDPEALELMKQGKLAHGEQWMKQLQKPNKPLTEEANILNRLRTRKESNNVRR